ncbi:MAG: AprI/Inh family metalloprotease inhibitor [Pseudolabrys sp.]|nr:AprI/Inh family metalloprotease inhibitor [Pseudolabrys sp.]MCW5683065.1 AprI/Inh family metalloprotease inhibitor [Pseudolabrys sp.]
MIIRTPLQRMKKAGGAVAAGFLLSLTGCASQQLATTSVAGASPADLAGRWMLSMPQAPACGLTLSGGPQGRIMPEGGCPGRFFTSRRYSLDNGTMTILDGESVPLARLTAGEDGFTGRAETGEAVTLTRALYE